MSAPIRRKVEPGIYERLDATGARLGFEVRWKDADGASRRRSVSGGLTEARDALAAARVRRVGHVTEAANPRMTFAAVADEFERVHVAGLRPNSQGVRRAALRRLRAEFGSRRITSIGRADVRRFVVELGTELKANSVLAYYSTMRAAFNFAASDLDVPVVFPKLKPSELPDPADDAREHRVLTDVELSAVLEACDDSVRLYFATLAETGARASEVLGLTPRRVGDGAIEFVQQLGKDGTLRPPKSKHGRRTVEVRRALTAELRLAGDQQRTFPLLTCRVVAHAWKHALAGIDAPRPTIHDLRHTHASKLIAAGWSPVEVAGRLGDSINVVLTTYAHEFDAKRRSQERRAMIETMYEDIATPTTSAAVVELRSVAH